MARRLAYNHYLCNAVQQWAFCSLQRSAWARDFYDSRIAAGKNQGEAGPGWLRQRLAGRPRR